MTVIDDDRKAKADEIVARVLDGLREYIAEERQKRAARKVTRLNAPENKRFYRRINRHMKRYNRD